MTRPPRSVLLLPIAVLALASPALAQHEPETPPKPTLASADYAKWETLGNGALSPDGKWVAYDLRRGNGSTEWKASGGF